MTSFWNKITIPISIIGVILILLTYIFSSNILNTITLATLLVTVLSTLYSNYTSDQRVDKQIKTSEEQFKKQLKQNERNLKEQLLFNKKQEIYTKLYKDLNEHWEILDYEKVKYYINNYPDYEPTEYITYVDFFEINHIMKNFNESADFLYMPHEIQEVTNKFLKYVSNNLEHYEYYKNEDSQNYHDAIEILSEIIPLLKQEIGFKK